MRNALVWMFAAVWIAFPGFARGAGGSGDPAPSGEARRVTWSDLVQIRQIHDPAMSDDGRVIAYAATPDRGDGEAIARPASGDGPVRRIPRGTTPSLTPDGAWLAAVVRPTAAERERARREGEKAVEKLRDGLAMVRTADGLTESFEDVESHAFSRDGRFLAVRFHAPEAAPPEDDASTGSEAPGETAEPKAGRTDDRDEPDDEAPRGTRLALRFLSSGDTIDVENVTAFAFSPDSAWLAYTTAVRGEADDAVHAVRLDGEEEDLELPGRTLASGTGMRFTQLAWADDVPRLAWLAAPEDDRHRPGPADLWTWTPGEEPRLAYGSDRTQDGWLVPAEKNPLEWTRDGARLFFGWRTVELERDRAPIEDDASGAHGPDDETYDPLDFESALDHARVDVWHPEDAWIVPRQKKAWEKEKDCVWRAVLHLDSGAVVRLADPHLPDVRTTEAPRGTLATSDLRYRRASTWRGDAFDVYWVDLRSGDRTLVAEDLRTGASLSTTGRFVAWYRDGHWNLFDADSGRSRSLTDRLDVPFANEDHDYPAPAPGYGVADWTRDDRAVLIHDKFDLWRFPVAGGDPVRVTGGRGRESNVRYRYVDLEPELDGVPPAGRVLLEAFDEDDKTYGFARARVDGTDVETLVHGPYRFDFVAKARDADRLLFTRESYREFPDLWVSDTELGDRRRVTDENPRIASYAWGEPRLVSWRDADGVELDGVLIVPEGRRADERVPVLVYFYRFFSHRLHHFNEPVVNHRPSFPVYASDGYAVFLPDVRFEIGRPGASAVRALVPGIQKLVDLGIADPAAIGLHGHSWSGYQAAYVVTQTDAFAAAVAGAPVSNMTSAYGGIRLGSGRARQFQYEIGQSRIGATLDDDARPYIDNSPVFQARYMDTPLLIQFGDRDEAVPWEQGIELYLAMRRLDKPCWFLQYRDEPHHLKKWPNKLDYSMKMKSFFDHFLKGAEAPAWLTEGVPYRGR